MLKCNRRILSFKHNTEFSPKICETCKCKNEVLECIDYCKTTGTTTASTDKDEQLTTPMAVNQRKGRILEAKYNHNHKTRNNHKADQQPDSAPPQPMDDGEKRSCIFDNNFYKMNATWSPLKCTKCICNAHLVTNCFVSECPLLSCPDVRNRQKLIFRQKTPQISANFVSKRALT